MLVVAGTSAMANISKSRFAVLKIEDDDDDVSSGAIANSNQSNAVSKRKNKKKKKESDEVQVKISSSVQCIRMLSAIGRRLASLLEQITILFFFFKRLASSKGKRFKTIHLLVRFPYSK